MGRISSLRRAQLHTLIVCLGAILAITTLSTPASASPPKTWDLTKESRSHRKENPIPDRHKMPEVWSWMYGEADTPSSYLLLEHFITPAENKAECSTKGVYEWNKGPTFFTLPAILYNVGPTIERGHTPCAETAEYPTRTFFMHPDNASPLAAVVRWKAPVTRTLVVSGSIQPTDSNVEGVVWQLDKGSTILAGPSEKADNTLTSFGPITVSVNTGESLYLEMTGGAGGGSYDTTAVTLHIVG